MIDDLDPEEGEGMSSYWHDAAGLREPRGWRRARLRIWASFWYAVGFVWGLLGGKP